MEKFNKTKILSELFSLITALLLCFTLPLTAVAGSEFIALAYHDVMVKRVDLTIDAVTVDHLIDQFEWLKVNGYHVVSIDDLEAARAGTRSLPDKSVLLCWDDGYTSFYTYVLPLLKAYQYPAVLSLVGVWMAAQPDATVQYGNKQIARTRFMSWAQVREAVDSGLVEVASHSYDLHHDVLADQFGDRLPATVARIYDPVSGTYENDRQFSRRIQQDLQASSDLILQHLGFRPRVLTWPFGRYNAEGVKKAAKVGMPITLALNPLPSDTDHLDVVHRFYPTENPDLAQFRSDISADIRPPLKRFFRVKTVDLLEPSQEVETRFSLFLDRIKELHTDMVIFDPVVRRGNRTQALFQNSRFPIAQDRLTRFSWHTSRRADAGVFLRLDSPLFTPQKGETADTVKRFFSALGKHAFAEGLVIDSPGLVQSLLALDGSDINEQAKVRFWNPDQRRKARQAQLEQKQDQLLVQFIQALEALQYWQPFQEVSLVVSQKHFISMDLRHFKTILNLFDLLIIELNEKNAVNAKELDSRMTLLQKAGYLKKCAFLFSLEKNKIHHVIRELQQLPARNIMNWGYQFDHFLEGRPQAAMMRPFLSKRTFPFPLRSKPSTPP
ncbi:MAG: poly-beta-1,6-N-acetyl-D-glucosamine N-deacetylase PgaB [Candidatus Electrothrix sp. ATG2]|nr:poly-beta-1,6-N-acetyl-D-glucosamine N-deacetylase PgaB [Candidatus Electrothrix sp. ATG2]